MKRFLAAALALMLMLTTTGLTALAVDTASVYVTITDDTGALVMTREAVNVTDIDADGKLTINDALYAAHEAKFDGGAAAGYGSAETQYGLSMSKLWGVENGGSYGYYVNNASAWSLVDEIKDGDHIKAFVYTDLTAWSDTYCYFDADTVSAEAGAEIALTLTANGYDEAYNPITVAVEGAVITVNGEVTASTTDTEGKATITINDAGTYTISATSESRILVAPVAVATITAPVAEAPVEETPIATDETCSVYVTITDDTGALVVTQESVLVTDADADGKLTINDALYAAHEAKFDGGAAAGYGSGETQYGLSLNKLWGVENGGSYGYYVNNASAWSLADEVKEGDCVKAFVYTDLTAWSDTYCYFDVNTLTADAGAEITLTLVGGYENAAVEGAVITVNGEATAYTTDAEGKATITINDAGTYTISATSESRILVAPVAVATINAVAAPETPAVDTTPEEPVTAPETGDDANLALYAVIFAVALVGVVALSVKGRKAYEK